MPGRVKHNLETLPAELRLLLLLHLADLATLRALIHASPIYHATYLISRENVLSLFVKQSHVEGTEVDAIGAVLSREYVNTPDQREVAIAFLDRYRHALGEGRWQLENRLDNLILMIRYQKYVAYLVEHFLRSVVAGSDRRGLFLRKVDSRIPLTATERIRIVRAIYRLQIYSHLFSAPKEEKASEQELISDAKSFFFGIFPPWELQEIAVIDFYLVKCSDSVQALFPHLDGYYYAESRAFIAACGPLPMASVLTQATDEQKRAVAKHVFPEPFSRSQSGPGFDDVVVMSTEPYILVYPADRWTTGIPDLSLIPDYEQPSAGWRAYRGDQTLIDEEEKLVFLTRSELAWGFVFWDDERLHGAGVGEPAD